MRTSEKNIERLLLYRRVLISFKNGGKTNIYSKQLASLADCTPEQVRRDIMSIGYSGSPVHGYDLEKLTNSISEFLDSNNLQKVALVGLGHLGRSIIDYFQGRRPKLTIAAVFDKDPDKIDRVMHGCRCYSTEKILEVIPKEDINVAIIAVPASGAQGVADLLVQAGIKGILNYAPVKLTLPPDIYVENRDMILAVEKVAYFARKITTEGSST